MPVIMTADFPPAHGGIQRYADRLAYALHQQGLPLAVIAPDQPEAASHDQHLPFRVIRYPRQGRAKTMQRMWEALQATLASTADDHLIAMSWNPTGIVASAYARLHPAVRLTILAHGSEIARQDGLLRRGLLRWTLAKHDVVAVSRYTASLLAERGRSTGIRVISGGIDPLPPSTITVSKAADPTILSVGRLVRRKGYDQLIQAIPALRKDFPTLRLLIVGDGPDRAYLQQLAKEQDVSANVELTGSVDEQTLTRLYGEAWCFAMPNRREGYDVEGFGLVFLEAALQGLPALGGRNSGAEDAIVEQTTGLLVDGRDTQDVIRGLHQLLSDPAAAQRMGELGRERALQDFQWNAIARRIVSAS